MIVAVSCGIKSDYINCNGFWQHLAAFGVGAGAGALTAATGGAGASIWAVGGAAAAGGAVTCATNNVIAQTGNNFSGISSVSWKQVGVSAAVGGVSGFVGGSVGSFAGERIGGLVINGMNVSSPVVNGIITGTIGGMTGGSVGGYVGGYMATGSGDFAKRAAWLGMWQGGAIGGVAGGIGAYASAKKSGINPWTGEKQLNQNSLKLSQYALERQSQRNISQSDITDAIKNPLKTSDVQYQNGRPSMKIIGRKATVIINPETSNIITVYPTHTKDVLKLTSPQ